MTKTKITTGDTSNSGFAASRPFTRQLDVVFPASDELYASLSGIRTEYYKGSVKLSEFSEFAAGQSGILAVCASSETEDTWCIDTTGTLTIVACKDTYEKLGLVGSKLPFKKWPEQWVLRLPLHDRTLSPANVARRRTGLAQWDARREVENAGLWSVAYWTIAGPLPGHETVQVVPRIVEDVGQHIPVVSDIPVRPSLGDELEDWNVEMCGLFEWVGMACLGSQRLHVNDNTNPYVAVYTPPNSTMGGFTHIQWHGFLSPAFAQSIIDLVTSQEASLTAIVGHAIPTSPVTYISSSGSSSSARAPTTDAEDTWCLITTSAASKRWARVESIGERDTRWG